VSSSGGEAAGFGVALAGGVVTTGDGVSTIVGVAGGVVATDGGTLASVGVAGGAGWVATGEPQDTARQQSSPT
jgi:hypothetical protein